MYTLKSHTEPEIFRKYGIRRYPTVSVFNGGKEVHRSVGYVGYDALVRNVKTRKAQNK